MIRIIHMAHKASEVGVSALCFKKPRAINMKIATWTLRAIAVTCPKCRATLDARKGGVVTDRDKALEFRDKRLPDRIWNQVERNEAGCWIWQGGKTGGYGAGYLNGRNNRVHRLVYEALVGAVPSGLQLDHLCRNRACCNPAHLEAVTSKENTVRGQGVTAQNARKTECKNGHPLAGDNLINKGAWRVCRECQRKANREYKRRKSILHAVQLMIESAVRSERQRVRSALLAIAAKFGGPVQAALEEVAGVWGGP